MSYLHGGEMKEEKHSLEILRVERKHKGNKAATLQVKFSGQGLKKTFKMYLIGCKGRGFFVYLVFLAG